jgi:Tol biopolymer transport system component
VRSVEPDVVFEGRSAGRLGDPLFSQSWALENTGQAGGAKGNDLAARLAFTLTTGSDSFAVVVIDDGVESAHPDLQLAPGLDFTGQGGSGAPVGPCDNHGTAVAGCIGARIDNGIGSCGIAPAARVLSARVMIASSACDGSWTSQTSWTVAALDWALSIGARVTNNSNSYGVGSAAIAQKYADTRAAGLVHFASAGDAAATQLDYPASLASVNAVSAIDRHGQLASFSNHGSGLALCAPGAQVLTTDRSGAAGYAVGESAVLDGTSFASAFAAGTAALVLARNPWLDAAAVEDKLRAGAADLGAPGYDESYGHGRVDAWSAARTAVDLGSTTRLSQSAQGAGGNFDSFYPTLSFDGRIVAFDSASDNLVAGDTNGVFDVFVRDRQSGSIERVSLSSAGAQANDAAGDAALSGDGRWVSYSSTASNLVPGDTNGASDVFVYDRQTGTTTLVSFTSTGGLGNSHSLVPTISGDGMRVAFWSKASNLVAGDTNGLPDCFVRDIASGATLRVSETAAGIGGNGSSVDVAISADGRYVAFETTSTNLVAGDTNGKIDILLKDLESGALARASLGASGAEPIRDCTEPALSADGRLVVFQSASDNLVPLDANHALDVFVRDMQAGTTELVSQSSGGAIGNASSFLANISPDGRFVAFYSDASNLVAGDTNQSTDLFLRDLATASTVRLSVSSVGAQGQANGGATGCALSWDGRFVAFDSVATGLVPGDAAPSWDVFVRDRDSAGAWIDLGGALPGSIGEPELTVFGGLGAGSTSSFDLSASAPSSFGVQVFGVTRLDLPFAGGVLIPALDVLKPFATTPVGGATKQQPWSPMLPGGLDVYVQAWALDPAAAQAFSASNALRARSF